MKLEKLIELRNKKGYSQQQMAHKLGISQTHYCLLEIGQKKLYYDTAKKIAKIFKLKPDDIFYPIEK